MKIKSQQLKVYIDARAKEKLGHYVALAKGEVSGLGLVTEMRDDKGNLVGFMVDDLCLLRQVSGSASTELDDAAVAALLTELDGDGADIGRVRLWWHSHGDLGVFWSTTDEECAAGLANSRYFVSIVVNKKGDVKCRVDLYDPFRVVMDDVPVETLMPDFGLLEQCKAEFAEKVTEAEPLVGCHGACGYGLDDDCITEKQYDALIELEDKLERGLITYPEYLDRYEAVTQGKLAALPKVDGFIN